MMRYPQEVRKNVKINIEQDKKTGLILSIIKVEHFTSYPGLYNQTTILTSLLLTTITFLRALP